MKCRVLLGLVVVAGALTACGPSVSATPPPALTSPPVEAAPTPDVNPELVPAGGNDAPAPHSAKVVPTEIRMPSIGVDAKKLIPLGLQADHTLQVPSLKHPEQVGWYTGAPIPGNPGSSVLAGHVDGGGVKGSFYSLSKLKAGALIYVERSDGKTAEFRVSKVEKFCKEKAGCPAGEKVFDSSEVYSNQKQSQLHMITCGGRYDAAHHNYLDNWFIQADLVKLS